MRGVVAGVQQHSQHADQRHQRSADEGACCLSFALRIALYSPSVRRALPPVGVQRTVEQLPQRTTVWECENTVVLRSGAIVEKWTRQKWVECIQKVRPPPV
jgi:hypothetical protein